MYLKKGHMKTVDRIVFIIMIVSFLGDTGISFFQGLNDGLMDIERNFIPNVLLHTIWSISTLLHLIIKGIKYKFK